MMVGAQSRPQEKCKKIMQEAKEELTNITNKLKETCTGRYGGDKMMNMTRNTLRGKMGVFPAVGRPSDDEKEIEEYFEIEEDE